MKPLVDSDGYGGRSKLMESVGASHRVPDER
jgi:hypothetical protein